MAVLEVWQNSKGTRKIELRELPEDQKTTFRQWTSQEFKASPLGWAELTKPIAFSSHESALERPRRRGYSRVGVRQV